MNEAISALAASNTTQTLQATVVAAADQVEDAVETKVDAVAEKVEQDVRTEVSHDVATVEADAKIEVGSAESEVAKIEAEAKATAAAAESAAQAELKKIEEAALHTVTNVTEKVRNAFVDAEQFVEKEAKKAWHLAAGGGSVIKNPA
jgi:actin-like ATPase involved in cell morphogenesis